jgi:rfaE bifunctional protein nucleotidyltransferase chain/domain
VERAREGALVERLGARFAAHDAVVVSDYGYGIVTPRVIAALGELQAAAPRIIVVDSKTLAAFRGVGVTAVKPNYDETVRLLGGRAAARGAARADVVARYGPRLLEVTGAQIAAVTLDTDGALFFERGRAPYRTYARPADHTRAGRRIVLTNGCFDILHSGHIGYLNAAKTLGDVLVVGVNSDASVRRLKGPERPINPLEERAAVLAGLSAVDHVVAFDEDTAVALCAAVRPDVFVKGGDYTRERLPEAAVVATQGGQVRILPYLRDRSTSSIIERVRAARSTAAVGRPA